jgi:tetratricopeptide (TPR) repeat protein
MKRPLLVLALVLLLVLGVGLFLVTKHERTPIGPQPVPMGETVTQLLPDAEGKLEKWTLTKRKVSREELAESVLPKPAPLKERQHEPKESARTLEALALEAWKHGELETALERFEEAVAADPDDAVVRGSYGRFLTLLTAYDKAFPHLKRAAELKPEDPQVWVDLLSLYERDDLFERAFYARQKAEELAGERKIVRDETGLYVLEGGKIFP